MFESLLNQTLQKLFTCFIVVWLIAIGFFFFIVEYYVWWCVVISSFELYAIQIEPCFSELLVARFHEVSDLVCCNLPCHLSVAFGE